jgi:hypothetical protein
MPYPKNYIKIAYPRKCNLCDYISNNPQMYHFHKFTHESIPKNTYCHLGCGRVATHKNTKGRYTCLKDYTKCNAYLTKLSQRTAENWKNNESRKQQAREKIYDWCGREDVIKKQKNTLKKKFGILTPEKAREYRHYARAIRKKAQRWAKEQGYVLGQQTYHVDHKFSILDSWHANLAEPIVNHPSNLQILDAKLNSGKGSKSSITLEELLYNVTQPVEPE